MRDGWVIEHEPKPSFNRHELPTGQGHETRWNCWCKPDLMGSIDRCPVGTLVIHRHDKP